MLKATEDGLQFAGLQAELDMVLCKPLRSLYDWRQLAGAHQQQWAACPGAYAKEAALTLGLGDA